MAWGQLPPPITPNFSENKIYHRKWRDFIGDTVETLQNLRNKFYCKISWVTPPNPILFINNNILYSNFEKSKTSNLALPTTEPPTWRLLSARRLVGYKPTIETVA